MENRERTIACGLVLCAMAVGGCVWQKGEQTLDLRRATIEIAAQTDEAKLAAEELAKHLELICGRRPALVASNGVFVVGRAPTGAPEAGDFESRADVRDGRVYFWGDGKARRYPGSGDVIRPRPALFGVYGFLEEKLGVKWVFPGDDGIVARPATRVALTDGWSWRFAPPLEKSEIRLGARGWDRSYESSKVPTALRLSAEEIAREDADRRLWSARQRLQVRDPYSFGHAFCSWQKRFEKTHPEYVALNKDGSRGQPPGREVYAQQCLSNPAVQDQMIADWVKAGKPDRLNLCFNDSWFFCRCAKCCEWDADLPGEAFELHKTDRTLHFYNLMCDKALALNPNVEICAYAYLDFRLAPRRERVKHPDRLVIAFVPMIYDRFCTVIDEWKAAGLKRFLVRPNYLCYNGFVPRGYERQLFEEFRAERARGMIGRDEDSFNRGVILDFETYAFARAMTDERVDFPTVEREFLSQFGAAAPEMAEYYHRVRARGERERDEVSRNRPLDYTSATRDDGEFYDNAVGGHTVGDLTGDLAVLGRARAKEGLTPVERRRIDRVKIRVELAVFARRLWEACKASDAKRSDAALAEQVKTRVREMLDFMTAHGGELRDNWGRLFPRPSYFGKALKKAMR